MEFSDANSSSVNAMFVQFAQYITHDITGAPGVNGKLPSTKYSLTWKTAVQVTLSNRCRHRSVELLGSGRLTLPPSPKGRTLTNNGLDSLGSFNDFKWQKIVHTWRNIFSTLHTWKRLTQACRDLAILYVNPKTKQLEVRHHQLAISLNQRNQTLWSSLSIN